MLSPALLQRLHDRFPPLAVADHEARASLQAAAVPVRVPAGAGVCLPGAHCTQLALVLEGVARVYKLGETGREITLYRVEPGQVCILTAACILSRQPFPAAAVAESAIEAVAVPEQVIRQLADRSPPWREFLFLLISQRLAEVISVIEEVAFRRMDSRVAAWLLKHAAGGAVEATHQHIAAELGTSREVVTRILRDFEAAGALSAGRGQVQLLDPGLLAERAR